MKFSKSTGGFYSDAIHGKNIPADAVEISDEDHAALLAGQSSGRIISADADGKPVLIDPAKVTADQVWTEIKAERDRRKSGGFKVGAYWFHSDAESKTQHLANKDTARDQLAAGGTLADNLLDPLTGKIIQWKTMSGEFVVLTCQLAFDIVASAKASEFATFTAAEMHKAQMLPSADPESYDFAAGWPITYQESLLDA